jgi:glycosyltransferase involved in cell wall biosynthesis
MSESLISIILPVYNQADHIEAIVEEYTNSLKKIPNAYELLLVVNGSRDNSLAICYKISNSYPNVRVIQLDKSGWGLAVKRGLYEAKGDLICYTNSARTSPQDLVLLLLYSIAYPNVVVKANRKVRESAKRRLGSLLYNLQCRALFDLSYWDINGTPKVFPRGFSKLLELNREDDLIDLEFNVVCRVEEYPVVEVPIFSTRRHGGKSTTKYKSALKMYWGCYQMWRSLRQVGNK